jgi:hypothetical protein
VWRQRSKGAETQRSRGLADHFLCSNVRQPRHGRLACAGAESRVFHLSGAGGMTVVCGMRGWLMGEAVMDDRE